MADFAVDDVVDDVADMDETGEGGGYVDDELDMDDDLDGDGDLAGTAPPPAEEAALAQSPLEGSTLKSLAADRAATRRTNHATTRFIAPDPRDYALRAVGDAARQVVVARFLTPCPDLAPPTRMRAVREDEGNLEERREAIKAEARQIAYENSHIGKSRRQKRNKQGYIDIPERDRKRWTVDIYTPGENGQQHGASRTHAASTGDVLGDSAAETRAADAGASVFDTECTETRQFVGTFEGKSTSRYAILLIDERARTADIVPVPPSAWYSMRQKRGRRPLKQYANADDAERAMKRKALAGNDKLTKFQEKAEEAHEKTEIGLGSMSAVHAKMEPSTEGSTRRQAPRRSRGNDGDADMEGLDFDEEFDNDDVAQVDKEEADKEDEAGDVRVDRETNEKKFRKLIKDEEIAAARPGSPASASDSDEEEDATSLDTLTGMLRKAEADKAAEQMKSPRRRTSPFSGSGSRPHSPAQSVSPKRSPTHTSSGPGLPPKPPSSRPSAPSTVLPPTYTARPGSSRMPTPGTASPSTSSAPGTPLRQEYAHLLPPPGTLPQTKHVVDVLSLMLRHRQNQPVPLKEFTRAFERVSAEQKTNLASIMKQVAQLSELQPGSKVYFVSLKPAFDPTSSSS
jgi:hypothetical protein